MSSDVLPPELYQINFDNADPNQATSCTIHTALDQLVLTQENPLPPGAVLVASDLDHVIYADTVIVRGPLSLPGKNVSIYARVITPVPNSKGIPASIDVSGAPAQAAAPTQPSSPQAARGEDRGGHDDTGGDGANGSDGAAGANGGNGNDGGTITLYMESSFNYQVSYLNLLANGSDGAPGGVGTKGQDGGDGGDGYLHRRPNPAGGHGASTPGTRGGDGGNGGNGGSGGNGGNGGKGGMITFASMLLPAGSIALDFYLNVPIGVGWGNGGQGGPGGAGGKGGLGGRNGPDARGSSSPGNDGTSGVNGQNGNRGVSGTSRTPYDGGLITYNDLALHSSVTQRSMTLQKAKLLYQMASPSDPDNPNAYSNTTAYGQAATLLAWLQHTTAYFAASPAPAPDGFTADEVKMMASIYSQATALARQLKIKRDYYGHLPSYVPQGSYSLYNDQLNSMLGEKGTFTLIESNYKDYVAALAQQKATSDKLDAARSTATAAGQSLQTQQQNAHTSADDMVNTINDDEATIEKQERILRRAIQQVENDLASLAGPSCILDSMLKALNLVATYSGDKDLKLANSIAGQVNDKALQPGMALAAGVSSYPTKYLVEQVDVLGDSVTSINEGYTTSQGVITDADPNAYKLIALQTQMDTTLDGYRHIASAQDAIDAINLYVTLVQKRNADIMKYNGYLAQIASAQAKIDQNTAQLNKFETEEESQNLDPSLAEAAAFMARIYDEAREQVIYTIYMASRSCAFWSLKPGYDVFAEFIGLNDPSELNAGTLAAANQTITTNFRNAVEAFGTAPQPFPNPAESPRTSSGATEPQRPFFRLTAADNPGLFEAFRAPNAAGDCQISFPIPPAFNDSSEAVNPFYGKANVRLGKVRPWVHGATNQDPNTSTNHVLTVDITHTGAETIVAADNNQHYFTHAPISKTFAYDYTHTYDQGSITQDEDFYAGDNKGDYAQPGPFTVWTITLKKSDNAWLNMSNVDEIAIEFGGTFDTFT
jgi:hypothetical protein